jgi:hypothetical protein
MKRKGKRKNLRIHRAHNRIHRAQNKLTHENLHIVPKAKIAILALGTICKYNMSVSCIDKAPYDEQMHAHQRRETQHGSQTEQQRESTARGYEHAL